MKRKHSNVDQSKELHDYLNAVPPNKKVIEAVNNVHISHHRDQPYILNIPNKQKMDADTNNSDPSSEENTAPNNQKRREITPNNSTVQPKKEQKLTNQPIKQTVPKKQSNFDPGCLVEAILNQCSPQVEGNNVHASTILQPQAAPGTNNYPLIDISDSNTYQQQPQVYSQPTEFTNWNQLDNIIPSNNYLSQADFLLDNTSLQQQLPFQANNQQLIDNMQPSQAFQPNYGGMNTMQQTLLQPQPIYQQLSNVSFLNQQQNHTADPFYLFVPTDSPEHINKFVPFQTNVDLKHNYLLQPQRLPSFQQANHTTLLPGQQTQQQTSVAGLPQLSFNSNELQLQPILSQPSVIQAELSTLPKTNGTETIENMTDSLNSLSMNELSNSTL